MIKSLSCAALLLAVLSVPAYAYECPMDMKKIDAALAQNPDLDEATLAEVRELRAEGERLHEQGKHGESVETLHRAMDALGIN